MPLQQQKLSTDKPALLRRYPRFPLPLRIIPVFGLFFCLLPFSLSSGSLVDHLSV